MSEKAELWHNLLELSGLRGNDYYIWLGCQREVQGLFKSCDSKLPQGLGTFSSIALACHEGQMIGQKMTRRRFFVWNANSFYFYLARLLFKLFQNSSRRFLLDSNRNFQVRLVLDVAKRRSHDWGRVSLIE